MRKNMKQKEGLDSLPTFSSEKNFHRMCPLLTGSKNWCLPPKIVKRFPPIPCVHRMPESDPHVTITGQQKRILHHLSVSSAQTDPLPVNRCSAACWPKMWQKSWTMSNNCHCVSAEVKIGCPPPLQNTLTLDCFSCRRYPIEAIGVSS